MYMALVLFHIKIKKIDDFFIQYKYKAYFIYKKN